MHILGCVPSSSSVGTNLQKHTYSSPRMLCLERGLAALKDLSLKTGHLQGAEEQRHIRL